jgi:hypothetical protein
MASNPISQAGVQGLRDSLSRAADAAARISQASSTATSPADIAEAAVDLQAAELQAKASAKVIETAERTLGSLIDILA